MKLRGLRGSLFEEMINRTISDYRVKKLALIQKIPTPIVPMKQNKEGHITMAFFDKKSTVDYIGVVQEIPVCFDAKESDTDRFPLKNIHAHQYEFMRDWESQKGVAFLLILFKKRNLAYYMTFKELDKIWKAKKDFNVNDLNEKYFIDMKNKIKVDILSKIQLDLNER